MGKLSRMYVTGREYVRHGGGENAKGQTMTEYALILAAVAIVAYITYQVMGQDIGSMVATIDNALSSA